MARGRRSAISSTIANTRQDPLDALLRPLEAFVEPFGVIGDVVNDPLSAIEDARRFDFDPQRGSLEIGGRVAKIVVHKRPIIARTKPLWSYRGLPVGLQVPIGVQFESPFRVVRCLRRKMRREVIFALKRNKKGAGARRRRRNAYSNVRC